MPGCSHQKRYLCFYVHPLIFWLILTHNHITSWPHISVCQVPLWCQPPWSTDSCAHRQRQRPEWSINLQLRFYQQWCSPSTNNANRYPRLVINNHGSLGHVVINKQSKSPRIGCPAIPRMGSHASLVLHHRVVAVGTWWLAQLWEHRRVTSTDAAYLHLPCQILKPFTSLRGWSNVRVHLQDHIFCGMQMQVDTCLYVQIFGHIDAQVRAIVYIQNRTRHQFQRWIALGNERLPYPNRLYLMYNCQYHFIYHWLLLFIIPCNINIQTTINHHQAAYQPAD